MSSRLSSVVLIVLAMLCGMSTLMARPRAHLVPVSEVRAAWLEARSVATVAQIDATVDLIARGHFNTIFVHAPLIDGDGADVTDPALFAYVLTQAHARGIAVHAWIECAYRLYMTGGTVDLRTTAEQDAQATWARDLMRAYPTLDGIHLDYIRSLEWTYPQAAYLAGVQATILAIRHAIHVGHAPPFVTATNRDLADTAYQGSIAPRHLNGDTPAWFLTWFDAAPTNYYRLAYVTDPALDPNWLLGPTAFNYQQDPISWLSTGAVDATVPLQYGSLAASQAESQLWASLTAARGTSAHHAIQGVGWTLDGRSTSSESDIVDTIATARAQGLGGIAVYTLGVPTINDEPLIAALTVDGPANHYAAPFATAVPGWLHR